jgi:lipopolysaccharide/colanic/teichoic acid biosynthesis glycosyltransferase
MIFQTIRKDIIVSRNKIDLAASQNVPRTIRAIPTVKVIFDKLFAGVVLIAVLPIMLLVGGAILLLDGRPICFSHERIGHDGKPFKCWKFRTMLRDSEQRLAVAIEADEELRKEWLATRKLRNDPRISALGQFLRKTSLDELPQFWNILRGEMSVVGPRPVVREELIFYGLHKADYISVRPGLTGAWQVSGRSNTTYAERVALDVDYIKGANLRLDLRIIWKTIGAVLAQDGSR